MQVDISTRYEGFVKRAVLSGEFASAEAVIGEGLRLLQKHVKFEALRYEIDKGKKSGEPLPYTPDLVKQKGRERLKKRREIGA